MDAPKISCLTITRNRPERLKRAVEFFCRQTWPDKELIVVVDSRGETGWVEPFFRSVGRDDVRFAVPPPVVHLGALRNLSVEMSTGEIVCTWDDDDLHHPLRLETQARALRSEGAQASFLGDSLQYFEDAGDLFVARWEDIGLPPSMMCVKSAMPRYVDRITDPSLGQKGSDTLVQKELWARYRVSVLLEHPHLYTMVYHGQNVWGRMHHVSVAFKRSPDEACVARMIPDLMRHLKGYFPYPLPGYIICKGGGKLALERGGEEGRDSKG